MMLYRLTKDALSLEKVREVAKNLAPKLNALNFADIGIDISGLETVSEPDVKLDNITLEIGIAAQLAHYRFEEFKSKKRPERKIKELKFIDSCLLYTSPSPRDS